MDFDLNYDLYEDNRLVARDLIGCEKVVEVAETNNLKNWTAYLTDLSDSRSEKRYKVNKYTIVRVESLIKELKNYRG